MASEPPPQKKPADAVRPAVAGAPGPAPEDEAPERLAVADRVALGRYPHRGPLLPLTGDDVRAVERALRSTCDAGD